MDQSLVHKRPNVLAALALFGLGFLAACGGGGDAPAPSAPSTPAASATVGLAGGTVTGPGGASVVIPVTALAADTTIGIEQTAAGAPPLPAGTKALGPVFAFPPHGTRFLLPATITVPFDAATVPAGKRAALVKTNDTLTGWELIGGTMSGNTISAPVAGFSYATVLEDPGPLNDPPHLVTEQ